MPITTHRDWPLLDLIIDTVPYWAYSEKLDVMYSAGNWESPVSQASLCWVRRRALMGMEWPWSADSSCSVAETVLLRPRTVRYLR